MAGTSEGLRFSEPANYDIYSVDGKPLHGNISLERVAEIVNLSIDEIAWAIEEYGRCDTNQMVVVQNDDVWSGPAPI